MLYLSAKASISMRGETEGHLLMGFKLNMKKKQTVKATEDKVTGTGVYKKAEGSAESSSQVFTIGGPGYSPRKKITQVAVVIVAIVLIAGTVFGLLVLRKPPCGGAILEEYLQALDTPVADEFDKKIKQVTEKIKSNPEYQEDITCAYMAYTYHAYKLDPEDMREHLEIIKRLYANGDRVDKKILNQKSIDEMEQFVRSLEASRDLGDKADGNG